MLSRSLRENYDVVKLDEFKLPPDRGQYSVHETLKGGRGVLYNEQHGCKLINSMMRSEGCVLLIRFLYFNLPISAFGSKIESIPESAKDSMHSFIRGHEYEYRTGTPFSFL